MRTQTSSGERYPMSFTENALVFAVDSFPLSSKASTRTSLEVCPPTSPVDNSLTSLEANSSTTSSESIGFSSKPFLKRSTTQSSQKYLTTRPSMFAREGSLVFNKDSNAMPFDMSTETFTGDNSSAGNGFLKSTGKSPSLSFELPSSISSAERSPKFTEDNLLSRTRMSLNDNLPVFRKTITQEHASKTSPMSSILLTRKSLKEPTHITTPKASNLKPAQRTSMSTKKTARKSIKACTKATTKMSSRLNSLVSLNKNTRMSTNEDILLLEPFEKSEYPTSPKVNCQLLMKESSPIPMSASTSVLVETINADSISISKTDPDYVTESSSTSTEENNSVSVDVSNPELTECSTPESTEENASECSTVSNSKYTEDSDPDYIVDSDSKYFEERC